MLAVKDLSLDLHNYRTVPKKNESEAISAMISLSPDRFWAVMRSILEDGYLPTENILILRKNQKGTLLNIVKEGNRRVAALKLIFGYVRRSTFNIPEDLESKIQGLTKEWKGTNQSIACAVYLEKEAHIVDKIVSLTHGKSQQAGRDGWKSIARARHNRDENKATEPGLDVLEKYLKKTNDLSQTEIDRWSGSYSVTVLDEALKNLAPRCGYQSAKDLSEKYPNIDKYRQPLDKVIKQIGYDLLSFSHIRDEENDFAEQYGFPSKPKTSKNDEPGKSIDEKESESSADGNSSESAAKSKGEKDDETPRKPRASATDDVRTVKKKLRSMVVRGKNREKVVTLQNEILKLDIRVHPHAFCFVLRSMFEISAKAFSGENKLPHLDNKGRELSLKDMLRNITTHLTLNNKEREKELHGAMSELAKSDGMLSVTSMNQLVHNKSFSVKDTHISALFSNVFPLLEAMNS